MEIQDFAIHIVSRVLDLMRDGVSFQAIEICVNGSVDDEGLFDALGMLEELHYAGLMSVDK